MLPAMLSTLAWILALVALGVALLPLTMRVLAGLPDRGYGLSRTIGIVVVGWLAYLASMLGFAAYVGPTVLLLALAVGIGCWTVWGRECQAALRSRRRLVIAEEVVFVAVFALAVFVRAYNADIAGQEKFMDYAFVNALLRTTTLPAEDMWLSGFSMPYYYLGYLLAGLPAKLSGTPGPIAYNLAVVWVFTSGFAASLSIVYGLVYRPAAPTTATIAEIARAEIKAPTSDAVDADHPAPDSATVAALPSMAESESEPVAVSGDAVGDRATVMALASDTAGRSATTGQVTTLEGSRSGEAVPADDVSDSAALQVPASAQASNGAPAQTMEAPAGEGVLASSDGEVDADVRSPGPETDSPAPVVPTDEPAEQPLQVAALLFGILGGLLTMVVGNLVGPLELIAARGWGSPEFWQTIGVKGLQAMPSDGWLPVEGGWWWRSSRVIANIQPDGITEFPYFSFLLGDLHPHYLAIPFTLLVVAIVLGRCLEGWRRQSWPEIVATGLALATLVPASTWDVPAFWGLFVLAAGGDGWRRHRHHEKLLAELRWSLAPLAIAAVAVIPYFIGYQSQSLGLGIVRERTPLVSMLIIFGPVMLATACFAAWLAARQWEGTSGMALLGRALVGLGVLVLGLTAIGQTTMAILLALLIGEGAVGVAIVMSRSPSRVRQPRILFCWLLGAWALTILFGLELIYLRDVFGTRMNSVFKFQYQAWLLLGLASAGGLGLIWTRSHGRRVWRALAVAVVALMLIPGMVYPLAATWTKSNGFRGEPTLMGDRFLERGAPADYRAIEWLRTSTSGRPVVVEAVGGDYTDHARVSTFSGLPTLMGWVGHELQWRGDRPELRTRPEVVDAVYRATTESELRRLAENYGIRYVFFGTLERAKYGQEAQSRLDRLLPVAYSRGGTTIYAASPDTGPVGVP